MDAGLGSLLQFIPSFMQLMKGMNNTSQKTTAAQLSNVNNAMVNPNNPLYQQMYGQYRQQGQQQLGESISQLEGQNRMLSSMGRTPLFSPERRGEAEFRAQVAGGPQIGIQAQQQTQQALMNAAQGLYGAGRVGGVNNQLLNSQYGSRAGDKNNPFGQGSANQSGLGIGQLGQFLSSGQQQRPTNIAQAMGANSYGLNAPGASQTNMFANPMQGNPWSLY